jgi:ATP-binding cassette subfamily F protein 3
MLRIQHISKSFASRRVIDGASFIVNDGEVAGLIGANGAGKTTLLRIIAGKVAPDEGGVEVTPRARIGYLRQGHADATSLRVGDVFPALFARHGVESEIERLAARIASADAEAREPLEHAYEVALARLAALPPDDEARRIAREIELRDLSPDERVGGLSGGEQTKLALIDLAVSRPDILLLDEPSNNLDLRGMAWLDEFLGNFDGPMLVVSHDRALLDDHASQVLEIDAMNSRVEAFAGGYSAYAAEKQRRRDVAWSAYRRQKRDERRMKREIRDIKATAHRHEKISQNDFYRRKAKKIARRAVVLERRLRREQASEARVEKPIARAYRVKADIEPAGRSGDRMLAVSDLWLCVEGRAVLDVDEFSIGWGERVVIAGPNGSGKTTLLRTLIGERPAEADVRTSASARIGSLPQTSSITEDEAERTAVDRIRRAGGLSETEARRFLHRFLFSGDGALTPIGQLSYGEQRRLALAELVLSGANLLVLDEPTNHLDIPSREAFEAALAEYDGAILTVTHDRYFIERFADRLLTTEGGRLREA